MTIRVRSASSGISCTKKPAAVAVAGVLINCCRSVSADRSGLHAPLPVGSEGHVLPTLVNFNRGRRAWCGARSRLTWCRPLLIAGVVSTAKEADFGCDDLDRRSFNVILVFVFADLQAAFNIDAITLLEVFGACGTNSVERHDSQPGSAFLGFSVAVLPPLIDRDREIHYVVAVVQVLHLRRSAQVPDDLDVV